MRAFSTPVLTSLLAVLTVGALVSGCELPDRKNQEKKRKSFRQLEDTRYAKDLTQPGPWVCSMPFSYSTAEAGQPAKLVEKLFVANADDGTTVVSKLRAECAPLEEGPKKDCEKEIDAGRFSCANPKRFITPYKEIAESVGNWICEMPFSYTVTVEPTAEEIAARKKAAEAAKKKAEEAAKKKKKSDADSEETEEPTPDPSETPAPTTRTLTENVSETGASATQAIEAAMTNCLSRKPEAAHDACATALTRNPPAMRCWNTDLGEGARPHRKLSRRRD
jgi:hypothetical protein